MVNKRKRSRRSQREELSAKELDSEITESIKTGDSSDFNPNPMKTILRVKEFPWTLKQKEFLKIALDDSTRVMFVNGPAGTAKTLLSVYCALKLLNMKSISDVMYIRSAVESSDRGIGFLPGSAEDKLKFYNLPFIDKLQELLTEKRVEKLEREGRIGMFPVNFARGMSWSAKCIIFDEAQNSSAKEITTVLTRMGKHSRCFILADPMQSDLHSKDCAFENMFNLFSDEESQEMGIRTFKFDEEDIMRSEIVKYLIKKLKKLK
jgi:phosphate starvation-inducible protein PhoH|tara:strand:+ start:1137 stop:1925 length:789 start_codon:yes stop_codon:yes gene_type:complete